MSDRILVYGAYGYTGTMIAERAVERGHTPVLAGRDRERLGPLAGRLGLKARAFGLDDVDAVRSALADVDLVLHAAGPFSATSAPMVRACLAASTQYLVGTGEIDVFVDVLARAEAARGAGVALVPGVGCDVVPTDCLARALHDRLPDAVELDLAIHTRGGPSRGTMRTMVEALPDGGRVRRDGAIVEVPIAWKTREVPYADRARSAVSIPWGDVSTAWHSTGIPDIVVYAAASPRAIRRLRRIGRFRRVLGWGIVQALLRGWVDRTTTGPDEDARRRGSSQAWGEARNARGQAVRGSVTGPEGYTLTADAAVRSAERALAGIPAGAWTPSGAFGATFVTELDGVTMRVDGPGPNGNGC